MVELTGTAAGEELIGTLGDDTISGLGGGDTLVGLAGNDTLFGGEGDDRLVYTAADNTGASDTYDGGDDTDTIRIELTSSEFASLKSEMLSFQSFVDGGGAGTFAFAGIGLSVSNVEIAEVVVDGVTLDLANLPNIADDALAVSESEAAGDVDINVLGNEAQTAVFAVNGDTGSVGAVVAGSNGGTFRINADGSTDFDAAGDFEDLAVGQTRTTTVEYSVEVSGVQGKYDLILVQDLSGSFFNDLPNVQAQFDGLFDELTADGDDVGFGVASFIDKPVSPFGSAGSGDFAFNADQAVSTDKATTQATLDGLTIRNGGDGPEAQLIALQQVALRATGDIGYRDGAQRFVVLQTDNVFHEAGDFTGVPADDGDTNTTETEDYPFVADVGALLQAADITVIFAVTSANVGTYQNLLTDLGVDGAVVQLSSNSSNLTAAVTAALDTLTSVETATLTATVSGENDAPVAADDTATTDEDNAVTVTVLGNDSDVDGDTLTVTAAGDGANGTTAVNPDGTVTYTPNADFNGTDTFTYTVSDGNGGTDTATVTVTVNAVNDAPVAADDTASTDEDNAVTVTVLGNDSDVDGDALTVTAAGDGANGTTAINPDGTVTYTPNADFNGTDTFTYTVSDGNGGTDTATVTVTVNAVNDAPVAADDTATTDEDNAVTVTVLGNDSDVDGDTLSVVASSNGANGTTAVNPDGTVTYTPNADFNGTDTFTYTVSDGNGGTDTATVTVTVNAVNDAPVAADDTATTDEDNAVTVTVLGNDSDVDGDTLSVVASSNGANGTTAINPDGTVTYTPNADFNGTDTFTYTVSDGNGGTDTATVTVTVNAVNDAPVAADDTATTDEDNAVNVDVLANDTDTENDTLVILSFTDGANGSVVLAPDGTLRYTPDADFNGTDSFDYTISDGNGGTDTASVTVTVNAVNDDPVAADDTATTDEDNAVTVSVLDNDSDVDGDVPTVLTASNGANGTTVLNPDGTVTYTPNADFNGTDTFFYSITDGNGGTDTASVTVTVNPINDAPVAVDDGVNVQSDGTLTFNPADNDIDVDLDTLTVISIDTGGLAGQAVLNPDGTVSYDPNGAFDGLGLGETGTDTFTYTVSDGNGLTDTATVTVTVGGVNDAPVAVDDTGSTGQGQATAIDVLDNDSDPNGDTVRVSNFTNGANGTVMLLADGTLSYTPDDPFFGTDTFTYTITDDRGGTDTATVTVDVARNFAPFLPEPVVFNALENQTLAADLNAIDFEGDAVTYTIEGGDDATLFEINATTGELTFQQAPDFENPDDLNADNRYVVNIGVADRFGQNVQEVLINVTDQNDTPNNAPTFTPQNNVLNFVNNDPSRLELTVLSSGVLTDLEAEDLDADTLIFTLFGPDAARFDLNPLTGVLSLDAPLTDPRGSFNDDAIFELQVLVEDGNGGSDQFDLELVLFTVA